MQRPHLLHLLASRLAQIQRPHPLRVAIDGVDAAGKTSLADELVAPIEELGREVIRASIDGFHHPRATRYRLGRHSAEGYYRDSFDYGALKSRLLDPLGPGGSLRFQPAIFDYRTDSRVDAPTQVAAADAILLFDGVFLTRPELHGAWDLTIFVETAFEISVPRALERHRKAYGHVEDVAADYARRYVPGQRLYLAECQPTRRADVVVDNNDLADPILVKSC